MARKTGLGRGLESLMGEASAEVGGLAATNSLPISKIKPNPHQPRKNFDKAALDELADSLKKNGVLQPLLVRKAGEYYEIVAGERRYQAAKLAGLKELPVAVRDVTDQEIFQLALIENLQRTDLDPIEEAQGFKQLIDTQGLTQEALGNVLSKSRSSITNSLRLLDLPDEVQKMMAERKLSAGHARAILAVPSEGGRVKLAQKVVNDGLSVRQTEGLAPLFANLSTTAPIPSSRTITPQAFKKAARRLRTALKTNVRVKSVRGKNKIEIEFADEEELARLVERIS